MNRRKFLLSLSLLGGGAMASYLGYQYVKSHSTPDLANLAQQKDLIAELCETIIPKTDTPGAKDALVHEYLIHLISNSGDIKLQNNFIEGLNDVTSFCISEYQRTFIELEKNEKYQVLLHFQKETEHLNGTLGKIKNKFLGKYFFSILKEYTCIGYCTSMVGATQGLAYEAIPSRYMACQTLIPGQKSWATK